MRLAKKGILLSQPTVSVVSIEDSTPTSVAFDTTFASITQPSTVNVHLSNGTVSACAVTWDGSNYVQDAAGDYIIQGTPTLPAGVSNPLLIYALWTITVQEEVFTITFTAPTGFQTYTILTGVTELTSIELIGGGASGSSVATITRAVGRSIALDSLHDLSHVLKLTKTFELDIVLTFVVYGEFVRAAL